jgi:C_GCAxxG_C_C family probable redox protein
MDEKQLALQYFEGHYSCSQSVFVPFAIRYGVSKEHAISIAAGFGGGIGQMGETCGAVTGACMALGLLSGSRQGFTYEIKYGAYALVQDFAARFRERCGALNCRDLLEMDISNPQQYQAAKDSNLFHTRCPVFILTAVEILGDMFEEPGTES